MKFMVSLVTDSTVMEDVSPEQMQEFASRMGAFMQEISSAGVLVNTGRLGDKADAKALRYGEQGKLVVTDGPFAESKEQIAGYMVLECGNLDEALDWTRKM